MKVRFTPSARTQFLAGLAFIHLDKPSASLRLRQRTEDSLRKLERFPQSGRVVPEFPDLPYREVSVNPYRFFYRVQGETIWIVAVWHGAQLPEPPGS
jgi:toxin ParE1/3/4